MSNEVEIKVKSTDKTDYDKVKAKSKSEFGKAGDEAGKSFGTSLKRWFTRDAPKSSEDGGRRSGKGFGAGIKKWFVGEGGGLFKQIGNNGGTVFGSGLLGAIKTPILGPALLAGFAAVVATVMPAVGSIAAGALILGFGAGLAGLGIMFAAKSKGVQQAWSKTLAGMGADMRVLSRPFESTLAAMAVVARRTFARFKPDLQAAFKTLAPALTSFGDQVGRAFEQLAPVIRPVSEAFSAVLAALGPAIQSAIGSTAKGLKNLAESVKENPDALADLVRGIGDTVKIMLDGIAVLNDLNGKIEQLTGGTSAVDAVMRGLQMPIVALIGPFAVLDSLLEKVGVHGKQAGAGGVTVASSLLSAAAAIQKTIPPAESLATKFARQKRETDSLIDSLFRLQNGYLTLSGAQISYQEALDTASKSLKDNGKTLDINTEKGRNNMRSLNDLAQAANQQTESMIRNNKGTDAAGLAAERSRANFVKLAQQMGATKPQAEAMARSMIGIPNVTRTAKLTANIADLQSRLKTAKAELANKNLTKERRAQLTAEISKLEAGIARAKGALASVPANKTVTITTRYQTIGTPAQKSRAAAQGHTPGNWHGGPVMPGLARGGSPLSAREFMAGEYGREIVKVDGTGNVSVTPAGNTARRMGQQGGGVQEVRLVIEGRGDVGDFLIKMLQPAIRNRGGNLNVILAGKAS